MRDLLRLLLRLPAAALGRLRGLALRDWLGLLGLPGALVLLYGLFAAAIQLKLSPGDTNAFLFFSNVENILRQTTKVGVAALGMTLVMMAAGIDLSVGSVMALATVVVALFLRGGAWPVAAAAAALLAGAAAGLVNGLLVTRLKMVPFIITLGTMLVVRGLALGLSRQQTVLPEPPGSAASPTWLHEMNAPLAPGRGWALWPAGVWLMLLCALTVWFVLRHMRFGRHVVAVGSNEATARLCGVEVERVKVAVYVLGGVFAALAGLMLFSRLRIGDPTTADGMELSVIAAVVIGGGSLSGGQGSVAGSLVGALVMGVIEAGTQQLRMESFWQKIITGAIIVAAVALDRLRARATRAGRQSRAEG